MKLWKSIAIGALIVALLYGLAYWAVDGDFQWTDVDQKHH